MAFTVYRASQRLLRMIQWFAGAQSSVTDFIVGSKTRTKFESVAAEMEAIDYQFSTALDEARPIAIYGAFNFTALAATAAYGEATFTASGTGTVTIPAGTVIAAGAKQYKTSANVTTAGGSENTATVTIVAIVPGATGNTASGTINRMVSAVSGITSVTNANDITSGKDAENTSQRAARFAAYIQTLTRGTEAALQYAAKSVVLDTTGERVAEAKVVEPPLNEPAGRCDVYIYNGVNGASSDLITQAQKVIDGYYLPDGTPVPGWKAAGVVATVKAAGTQTVPVTMTVTSQTGADTSAIQAQIVANIQTLFTEMAINSPLRLNEIVERSMMVPYVVDIAVTEPTANVTPTANSIILPGTITVTVA